MTTPTPTSFTVERQGAIARVLLASPPLNTLDIPLMRDLAKTFKDLAQEPEARRPRAILLSSAVHGQFSAGIDPKAILSTDVHGRKQVFLALGALVEAVWFCHIPVVCDINGPALAGGAVLATLGDFAVMDANAGKISYSEVKVGLPIPYFVQRLIMSKTNPSAWSEIILLGKNIDAHEALRIGFANAVYSNETEREEALQGLLGRIARLPPAVVAETLRQKRAPERQWLEQFHGSLASFADFLTDDFLGKGLKAIVKGESPKF